MYKNAEQYYSQNSFLKQSNTRSFEQWCGNKISRKDSFFKDTQYPFEIHIWLEKGMTIAFNPTETYIIDAYCSMTDNWYLSVKNGNITFSRYSTDGKKEFINFKKINFSNLKTVYNLCKADTTDSVCMKKIKNIIRNEYVKCFKYFVKSYQLTDDYPF